MGTIQTAKASMGYSAANQRERCSICAHAEEDGARGTVSYRCTKGGFYVTAWAICKQYKNKFEEPNETSSGQ